MTSDLESALAQLGSRTKSLVDLCSDTLSADGDKLYAVDVYMVGAVKRARGLLAGFSKLVAARNYVCVGALVRMQLETAARLFALTLCDKPHQVASDVIGGTPLRRIKDRAGKKLTDTYIIDQFAIDTPWVKTVYQETSKFVHFSEKQVFGAFTSIDNEAMRVSIVVGSDDDTVPDSAFLEAVRAFDHSTDLLLKVINSWRDAKQSRAAVAR